MNWPFSKGNRALRAIDLDQMSYLRCMQITRSRFDILRVTLEADQFTIRQDGTNQLMAQYRRAGECERFLKRYYRELVYKGTADRT